MKAKTFLLYLGLALALFSCTKRQPEEVDYAPDSPFNPYPPDSATNIDHTTLDVTLRWTATDPNSGDILTYAIYFDTLNPPAEQLAAGLTASSYFITGLKYKTTYYWKLYITDDAGVITSGPVWQFTTLPHANSAPTVPVYSEPADDSVGTYPTLRLAWSGSDPNGVSDTVNYSLYLGRAAPLPLLTDTRGFSHLACCLDYSTHYLWQVVATDNHGAVSAGPAAGFTTRESPWFLRAPMPLARKYFATAMAGDKIYIIGGLDEGNNITGTVQEYDPAADAWSIKTSMPTPRYELAAASANGLIYAVGGKNVTDSIVGATEEYNPTTDIWTIKRSMIVPRWSLIAQSVNGLVYAIGGMFPAPSVINMAVEVYTPATNKWVKVRILPRYPNFPPMVRLNTMSGVIDGRIYIAGGFDPWKDVYSANLNIFNTSTNSFSIESPLPKPRTNGLGVIANGCFYVIGGYDGNYLRRVEKYDPATRAWTLRGDMLNSRSGCGGGVFNNNIFVVGGFNPSPVVVTEEYQTGLDP